MKLFKNKNINRLLNDYPCADYLHNALRFLADGKWKVAYDEICHAIVRSGGCLSEDEKQFQNKLLSDVEQA